MVSTVGPQSVTMHGLRQVMGYEVDAVDHRVKALELTSDALEKRVQAIELDGATTRNTIKIAAAIIAAVFATGAGGVAWAVVKIAERPAVIVQAGGGGRVP